MQGMAGGFGIGFKGETFLELRFRQRHGVPGRVMEGSLAGWFFGDGWVKRGSPLGVFFGLVGFKPSI